MAKTSPSLRWGAICSIAAGICFLAPLAFYFYFLPAAGSSATHAADPASFLPWMASRGSVRVALWWATGLTFLIALMGVPRALRDMNEEDTSMNTKLAPYLIVLALVVLGCTGLLTATAASVPPARPAPLDTPDPVSDDAPATALADNPNPPAAPVKLVFVHHSTGGNWLASSATNDPGGDLGKTLMDNNYFVSATNYGWGPNQIGSSTDILNWPEWFTGPDRDTIMAALYKEYNQNICNPSSPSDDCYGDWPRLATDPGGENQIVMFKSCFPNSDLYREPSDELTVEDAQAVYNDILTYFASRQDKLFIVITAPPLQSSATAPERAANARSFNNWLTDRTNGWLKDYSKNNVAVFDYYNVLTSNGSASRIDDPGTTDEPNDYAMRPNGNHHYWDGSQIRYTQTINNNFSAYPSSDSHPTTAGHQKASAEFVQLLNVFYNRWKGTPPPVFDHFVYLPLVLRNYTPAPPVCAVPLTGVTISGQSSGYTNTLYTFNANPTPSNATTPIAYTWSPAPNSGQGTASASYQWNTTGSKSINVTASNCSGVYTRDDAHTITIQTPPSGTVRPFPDTTVGIHVFNDQLASDMSEEQFRFAATHYAGTQKMTRSDANHLRTYNPNFVILHYRLGLGLGYRVVQTGCAPTGDWITIIEGDNWVQEWPANVSENWLYHWPETGTMRVLNCDWGWYLMNLDDSSWRAFWSGELVRQLQANDDDGIFADSFSVPNYLGFDHFNPNLPEIDNTFESQWTTRLENLMTYVQQGSLADYYFIPNVGEWITSRETTDYSIADGVMIEGFGGGVYAGYYELADWQLQMNRILAINQNKVILAQQYVSAGDVNDRMFLLGSYLLIKGRYTYINLELDEAPEWFPEYGIPIGSPTGGTPANIDALWNAGWGVYARTYSNGLVLVNPTTTSQVVNLSGTYYQATPNGGGNVPANGDVSAWTVSYPSVTTVTLAPNRAAVLLNSAP